MYCFSHCNFKYRFKYRQNAPFTVLVSKKFLQFQIVLNTVTMHNFTCTIHVFNFFSAVQNCFKYHQNACFRDIVFIFFLQFKFVSNTVTVHALLTLLSFFRCSFKYRHSACFRDIVFKRFLQFPIFSNTVRIHLCSFKSVQIHSECIL